MESYCISHEDRFTSIDSLIDNIFVFLIQKTKMKLMGKLHPQYKNTFCTEDNFEGR